MKNYLSKQPNSGFVLPIGMVMMLILSIIGISTLRGGILQEKMSSNYLDKEQSFQAAESALRIVQRITLRQSAENIQSTDGYHNSIKDVKGAPSYDQYSLKSASAFEVHGLYDASDVNETLVSHPKVIIEELSNTESLKIGKQPSNKELAQRFFRITALSSGETKSSFSAIQGVVLR